MCEVMRKYEEIAKTQGIAEGKAGIAKKLLASGTLTDEQVAEFTGHTLEEIAAIRNGSAA